MLGTRSAWRCAGWSRASSSARGRQPGRGRTTTRNLLGFKDGTANPSPAMRTMDELVWVAPDDGEPALGRRGQLPGRADHPDVRGALGPDRAGRAGGDHRPDQAYRRARWDRAARRTTRLCVDPNGAVIPLDAHIRLANPRTRGSEPNRILRRGYSFSRGFDEAGQLDQGLLFIAYQRDLPPAS